MNTKLFLLMVFITLSASAIVIKQVFPTTDELIEDIATTSISYPKVKRFDNKNFVIAFFDDSASKIGFQIYDQVGRKIGTNVAIGPASSSVYKRYLEVIPGNLFITAINNAGDIEAFIYNYNGIFQSQFAVNSDMMGVYDSVDVLRLTNGNLVFVWTKLTTAIYYRVFDSNGNNLGSSIMVDDLISVKCSPSLKPGTGSSFMLCWRKNVGIFDSIYCRYHNEAGALGAGNVLIDSFISSSRDSFSLTIEKLNNGNYVLAYSICPSVCSVYFSIITPAGASVILQKNVNTVSPVLDNKAPEVAALSGGGFVITYSGQQAPGGDYNAYKQIYDQSGNAVGSLLKSHFYDPTDPFPSVTGIDNDGYIITWTSVNQATPSSNNDNYFNIWYPDEINVTCSNFSIVLPTSSSAALDFTSHISDDYMDELHVKFSILPSSGTVKLTSNGSTAVVNTGYMHDILVYNSSSTHGTFSITYTAVDYFTNISPSCTVNISVCYPSCQTCTSVGTAGDHLCTSCRSGYFSLGSSCFLPCPSSFGGSYYYPNTAANTCIQCSSPCDQCTGANECVTCANGYLLVDDLTTNNCQVTCPVGYYKLGNTCKKCDPDCTACFDSASQCTSCISAMFYYSSTNQCMTACPSGYFGNGQHTCVTCKDNNQFNFDSGCVTKCPDSYIPDTDNYCKKCIGYMYQNTCYTSCPEGTFTNKASQTCYTCTDINMITFNRACISSCPDGYLLTNNTCETCSSRGKCPVEAKPDKNEKDKAEDPVTIAKEEDIKEIIVPTNAVCLKTSCLNDGICLIRYNKVRCTCTEKFVGDICQFIKETFNYDEYIRILMI
jgi:hypothetical protein